MAAVPVLAVLAVEEAVVVLEVVEALVLVEETVLPAQDAWRSAGR